MLNQPGALLCDWTRGVVTASPPCTKQEMVVVARWLLTANLRQSLAYSHSSKADLQLI